MQRAKMKHPTPHAHATLPGERAACVTMQTLEIGVLVYFCPRWNKYTKDVQMGIRLRWTARVYAALAGCLFLGASASSAFATTLDEDRTRGDIHGLFEIREAAVKFVAAENVKNGRQWQVLEPNRKILVTRCAAALQTAWAPKSQGLSGQNVAVRCARTVQPTIQKNWQVFVPVAQETKARH